MLNLLVICESWVRVCWSRIYIGLDKQAEPQITIRHIYKSLLLP